MAEMKMIYCIFYLTALYWSYNNQIMVQIWRPIEIVIAWKFLIYDKANDCSKYESFI